MKSIIRFIVIIGLLLFNNCSKETELEIPYSVDKMVVKSILFADQPVKVELSKSRPLDSGLVTFIRDATIQFYENNIYIEDLVSNHYYYVSPSDYICKAGAEYSIYIYHDNLGSARASVTIPDPVPVKVVDTFSMNKLYTWRSYDRSEGKVTFLLSGLKPVLRTKIEINDNPGEKNYYILDVDNPPIEVEFPEHGVYSFPASYDSEEEIIDGWIANINYQLGYVITLSAYFSDKMFNGKNFIFTIFISKELKSEIHIKLYSISEEYYYYIKSLHGNKDNPFAEPVIIYSNVVNGIGILGGASCYIDSTLVIQ